ncbi:MAG: hypothetical protein KJO34_16235 [Deltaproteobacteria bacterium]|nr:hypothetical protein [Deltaproteobacteria bacterium]
MTAENDEKIVDKGGTRSGIERRQYVYTEFAPERRSGKDRRKALDRRGNLGRRRGDDRKDNQISSNLNPIERRDRFRGFKR